MDKIIIKNLELFAKHGVFKEEKFLGQKFIIDLDLSVDLREAGKTDNLDKSIDYGKICYVVEEVFTKASCDLIEAAAEKVLDCLLNTYPSIQKAKIKLKKPWAPIGKHLDYASIEMERERHTAYLSIGSNIGDKEYNLNDAIERINKIESVNIIKVSSFVATKPWGYTNQEDFLNGAIKLETLLTPKELMKALLDIENEMKRERIVKWGPRIIDLDIIFYDDLITDDDYITLPHPLMEERVFVLEPLNEIAPNFIHPINKKRIFKLLQELKEKKE